MWTKKWQENVTQKAAPYVNKTAQPLKVNWFISTPLNENSLLFPLH